VQALSRRRAVETARPAVSGRSSWGRASAECRPSNARVLDCSSGTGQLAVGLARLGLDVVAKDASAGMVRRTLELADEHSVPLQALRVAWDDLPDYLDPSTFDLVICVGNSLFLAPPSWPLVAMITAVAKTTMTPVKIKNPAVFDPGTTSRES
jgi:SAM-dependent methyltransferase